MKRNIINLKYDQLSDLLIESKKNQDLTILCKNGRFTCNGFLFVTIFPDLSESLNLVSICEETPTISIPDSYLSDFQDFFNCLYERLPKLKPSKFLQTLLQWPKVSVTSSDIKIDTLKYESLKGRFLDDVKPKVEEDFDTEADWTENIHDEWQNECSFMSEENPVPVKIQIAKEKDPPQQLDPKTGQICKSGKHKHGELNVRVRRPYSFRFEYARLYCEICDLDFKKETQLFTHVFRDHGPKAEYVKCFRCHETISSVDEISHMAACALMKRESPMKKTSWVCSDCGSSHASAAALWSHKKYNHEIDPVTCESCGKEYKNPTVLKDHIKDSHKEKSPCPFCGLSVNKLKDHIARMHTSEDQKRFHCETCGKGFFVESKLKRHMMIHANLQEFRCRYGCNVGYNDDSNRAAHERKTHGKCFSSARLK